MDNRVKWVKAKMHLGWILLIMGALVILVGIIAELQKGTQPYNYRIITGVGILLTGYGIGNLVRYRAALRDSKAARRLSAQERDERTMFIRARSGSRAYWASALLVYAGLMWASFAARGSLPDLSGDVLWYFLAGAFLIPFGVYVVSFLVDQKNH